MFNQNFFSGRKAQVLVAGVFVTVIGFSNLSFAQSNGVKKAEVYRSEQISDKDVILSTIEAGANLSEAQSAIILDKVLANRELEGPKGLAMWNRQLEGPKGLAMWNRQLEGPKGLAMNSRQLEGPKGLAMNSRQLEGPKGLAMNSRQLEGPKGLAMNNRQLEGPKGLAMNNRQLEGPKGLAMNGSRAIESK